MRNVTRLLLRTGASAASLGASGLEKTADALRGLAGETPDRGTQAPRATEVAVEHRDEPRTVETVVAAEKPPRPVPRRISNPKAARKVRKREGATKSGPAG